MPRFPQLDRTHFGLPAAIVAVAVLYAATARLGLLLDPVGGFATLVWAPTGIALAATVLLGRDALYPVFVGALAANLLAGAPFAAAGGIAAGNTLEAFLGAWILRRLAFDPGIRRLRDAYLFLVTAAVAPVVSATVGVTSLLAAGTLTPIQAGDAWQAWWVGDLIGALLVAPPILVWAAPPRTRLSATQALELAGVVVVLVAVAMTVFFADAPQPASYLQAYLMFPLLLVATVRFDRRGATLAVFVTAAVALAGTAQHSGPFAQGELRAGLLALQTFMGIVAASFLLLATALKERADAREALRETVMDDAQLDLVDAAGPLYRQLVEGVTDYAIFALDRTGRVLTWNRGAERLKGYAAREIIGRHISIFYPPDVARTGFPDYELETAAREGRFEDEGWRVRKDGSRFWANVVITPLRNAAGAVVGYSKVTRDLTARRDAEEGRRQLAAAEAARLEAEKAETTARFLAQASEVLSSSLDYDQTLTRLAELFVPGLGDWCVIDVRADDGGVRRVTVAHTDPARLDLARRTELEYPTDMNATTGVPQVFRTGQPELYPTITDEMMVASARDERHLAILRELGVRSAVVVPITARDRVHGVLTLVASTPGRYTAADLELAKELGRRAGLAIENALLLSEVRTSADRLARLQMVTSRLAAIVSHEEIGATVVREGLAALGAVHGALCVFIPESDELEIVAAVGIPDDVIRAFRRYRVDAPLPLSEAVRDRAPIFLSDRAEIVARFPHLREANQRATTDAWIALPLTVAERVLGGVAFGFAEPRRFDAAEQAFAMALAYQAAQALERTRLYAAERRARADAEIANRAKSDFLATMSHELRTPLNAIGGYAELLEMGIHGPLSSAQLETVERIRRSERRLRALIEDVLNFARIEAGRVELDVRPIAVRDLLLEAETVVAPQIAAAQLAYAVGECDPSLQVLADATKVQQILVNLLANAIKFTPARGSIRVESDAAGDQVEIRVRDTGSGIPGDKLAVIFDPFVQLGRSLTNPREGSGLGLAISRDLARAMGGELRVQSEVGVGSTFTLVLPMAPRGAAAPAG